MPSPSKGEPVVGGAGAAGLAVAVAVTVIGMGELFSQRPAGPSLTPAP